jgi:hypothetical protein
MTVMNLSFDYIQVRSNYVKAHGHPNSDLRSR